MPAGLTRQHAFDIIDAIMNMPIMLKIPESDYSESYFIAMANATFCIDDNKKIIEYAIDLQGESFRSLEAVDGNIVKISDLGCKTYSELVVALDVNNLLHGATEFANNTNASKLKIDTLIKENAKLKKKLQALKKALSD